MKSHNVINNEIKHLCTHVAPFSAIFVFRFTIGVQGAIECSSRVKVKGEMMSLLLIQMLFICYASNFSSYDCSKWSRPRSSYFTRRLLMTWGYAMTFIQGNLGKVKVTGKNSAKFASGLYLFYWEIFEVLTLRNDEGVSWLSTKVIWSRSQTEKVHILRLIVMEKH